MFKRKRAGEDYDAHASTPLEDHVNHRVEVARREGIALAHWNDILFGERGFGPAALPWDRRFRPLEEFRPRWEAILRATNRDWVNLDLLGVKQGHLLLVVEYLTGGEKKRLTPAEIAVNGGPDRYPEFNPLYRSARW